jgi:hypothetical protein
MESFAFRGGASGYQSHYGCLDDETSLALDGNDPHCTTYLTRTTASDCTNVTPTQWCEKLGLSHVTGVWLCISLGVGEPDLKLTPQNHVTLVT